MRRGWLRHHTHVDEQDTGDRVWELPGHDRDDDGDHYDDADDSSNDQQPRASAGEIKLCDVLHGACVVGVGAGGGAADS